VFQSDVHSKCKKVQVQVKRNKKKSFFLDTIILNVLRDLLFSRNEPLKLDKG